MYAVKERTRDGITTYSRQIVSTNILEVEAGTNGYHGGDAGHGSKTYFRIKNLDGTAIDCFSSGDGVEVRLYGDCELSTIIKALKFIVKVLKKQAKHYGNPYE